MSAPSALFFGCQATAWAAPTALPDIGFAVFLGYPQIVMQSSLAHRCQVYCHKKKTSKQALLLSVPDVLVTSINRIRVLVCNRWLWQCHSLPAPEGGCAGAW